MCHHKYTSDLAGYPGDTVEPGVRSAFSPLFDHSGKRLKPFWTTEGSGTNSRIANGIYRHTLPYARVEDAIETSDRQARYVAAALARGAGKIFYSMHSHTRFGSGNAWRSLVTDEGCVHPSAAAHSAMAWSLGDAGIARRESPAVGVTSYLLKGAGHTVTVLALRPKHALYALPAGGFDLFGNRLPKGTLVGKTLVYLVTP